MNANEMIRRMPNETNVHSQQSGTDVSKPIESNLEEVVDNFHDMNLKEELLRGINGYGFEKPLEIQKRAIMPCIKGHDVIVEAESDTGKTTSALIAILQQIDTSLNKCQALIVAPTRGLALEIQKMVITLGEFIKASCHVSIGGKNVRDEMRELLLGSHVVVCTLGRVCDMIARKSLKTQFIKIFVLDKALPFFSDDGLKDEIQKVFKSLEKGTQVILLSHPMPEDVLDVSSHFLHNPVRILMQKDFPLKGFKNSYINNTKKTDTKNGMLSDANNYSGPSVLDDSRTNVFYIKVNERNDSIDRQPSKTNDHPQQSVKNFDRTIVSNLKKLVVNFYEMNLKEELLHGIYKCGFKKPTTLQKQSILFCIMGRDVIAQSPPCTGKTTSVVISILQQIDSSLNECQALILTPTHKLAKKIKNMVIDLGEFVKVSCLGGFNRTNLRDEMRELQLGSHIVVGTPDRLYDMISRKSLKTEFIKIFVLDKTLELLSDDSLKDQIKKVFKSLEKGTQVILLSHPMPNDVLDVSSHFLHNPVRICMQKDLPLKGFKNSYINNTKKTDTKNGQLSDANNYSGPSVLDDSRTKAFYINDTERNDTNDGQPSETNDHSQQSDKHFGRTIESDLKKVVENFHDMNLKEELLHGIYKCGFKKPTTLQKQSILLCIMGHDVIAQSPPGTGKTTSVVISILQQIDSNLKECQALILTPTHKLAKKIKNVVIDLGEFVKASCLVCFNRTNLSDEMRELQLGSHIVVGTPGCVYDMISIGSLKTEFIKIFVLHKALELLSDDCLKEQIKEVFKLLQKDTQVILLSNPMPKDILDLNTHFLRSPVVILMQSERKPSKDFKQIYINNTKNNDMKNGHPSKTNDDSDLSSMDVGETVETDLKELVDNFLEMNLKEGLLHGIYEYGFEKPLAFQQRVILQCINGHDVIVHAQSGNGKTTSVLISILQQIDTNLNESQALIVVPSFELARQIQNIVVALGKFLKADCHACIGNKYIYDMRKRDTFPHVVVGTPGCVSDLIDQKILQTNFIKIFVLKEANKLLQKDQVKKVFKTLEEDTQVILLLNNMSKNILDASTYFLSNPVRIFMEKEELTLEDFKQFYIGISKKNETANRRPIKINDSSAPLIVVDGGTIESDQKEVVDNFHDMDLKEELLHSIYLYGLQKPSAIQQHIILTCIKGRDIIVQAQSSTGKTTSVLIYILQQINPSLNECQALILVPSQRIALQIQKVFVALGDFMKADCHAAIGEMNICNNINKRDIFSHVVVGTPAFVSDMIATKSLRTEFIKIFVLDNANLLFYRYIEVHIYKVFGSLKKDTQVILLSDQMSENALAESTHLVSNPVHICMHREELTAEGVKHFFVNLTKEECKFDSLCNLFDTLSIIQVVIFCKTCDKVDWLTEKMRLKTFNVSAMHKKNEYRQNSITLFHFCSGSIRVLITTHMFARIIDVQHVSMVINYDLPFNSKGFIQSIERSQYVGRKGVVLNFIVEDKCRAIKTSIYSSPICRPNTDYTNQAPPSLPTPALISKDSTVISVTKHYSGPFATDDSRIVEYDWKEVVDNFHEMNLKEELLRGIYEYGLEKPLAIQKRSILPCIKGHDVIVQAQSGTGKTTSVLISILQRIDTSLNECQALILTPSRKIAVQIQKVVIALGDLMKVDCYACILGINNFHNKLNTISHVIIGTPTCVYDLIARKLLQTNFIKILVLDEINKLSTRGTKDQITEVFKVLEEGIQVILLSGPTPEDVVDENTHILHNPVHIFMQK